jgi:hypothetical protein
MTICISVLTNYVPAVAVIRKRLVLFILNRFKGYSDGNITLFRDNISRVLYKEVVLVSVEIKFVDTYKRTGKGEGNLLCKN